MQCSAAMKLGLDKHRLQHHPHVQQHLSSWRSTILCDDGAGACSSATTSLNGSGCGGGCGSNPSRAQRVLRWSCGLLLATAAVSGWGYSLVAQNKCSMDTNLHELLMFSTEQLTKANIPFWLEYGTLLGAIRDHAIVPWEYDVDLAVSESDCERVLSLRGVFKEEKGWNMYGRGEFIPEKSSLFGLVGGSISAPCVRVYHSNAAYPLDIYWSRQLTHNPPAHVTPEGTPYISPPERTGELRVAENDNQILCDYESFPLGGDWNDHHSACRWRSDMFPLATAKMYGRSFPVPRYARKILTQTFGADWMTPRPKGYKALLCPPVWHTGSGVVYAVVCGSAAALALALFVYLRYLMAVTIAGGFNGAHTQSDHCACSASASSAGTAHAHTSGPMGGGGSASAMAAARALTKEHADYDAAAADERTALALSDTELV